MTITGIIGQKHSSQYIEKIDVLIRRSSSSAVTDLRIKTSYPFNEVNAVFLLNNPRYQNCIDCFDQNLPTINEVAAVLLPSTPHTYLATYVHTYMGMSALTKLILTTQRAHTNAHTYVG